jgi:hypothetical protein
MKQVSLYNQILITCTWIHLKPDAVSKHQRPYKLPPHKRDVLRHQLDELLSQGIIAPVKSLTGFSLVTNNSVFNQKLI